MHASTILRLGAAFAGVAVALGAFAAHAMRDTFPPDSLQTFETGVRWQMYHALALVACTPLSASRRVGIAAMFFVAGIVLFSGSLYGYVFTGVRWFVYLTPIGGVAFVAGWLALLLAPPVKTHAHAA